MGETTESGNTYSGSGRRPERRSPASRAFYTPTGALAWRHITKLGSGIATMTGLVSIIVGLGVKYGELRETVSTQIKQIEELHQTIREQDKKRDTQIDRVAFAIKAQNELIVSLRIAVAASAAAESARHNGRYDREKVLGDLAAIEPARTRRPAQQARMDAQNALDKARRADPLAALADLDR